MWCTPLGNNVCLIIPAGVVSSVHLSVAELKDAQSPEPSAARERGDVQSLAGQLELAMKSISHSGPGWMIANQWWKQVKLMNPVDRVLVVGVEFQMPCISQKCDRQVFHLFCSYVSCKVFLFCNWVECGAPQNSVHVAPPLSAWSCEAGSPTMLNKCGHYVSIYLKFIHRVVDSTSFRHDSYIAVHNIVIRCG